MLFVCGLRGPLQTSPVVCTAVRGYRWHAEKVARGPALRRYGYKDGIIHKGLLPRVKDAKRLPIPAFKPVNQWSEEKALFGQNDYIDILGDGSLHPVQLMYKVPYWLRGFQGTEYQMLLRKREHFGEEMSVKRPNAYNTMNKRINYLYRFLNHGKTKDYFWYRT